MRVFDDLDQLTNHLRETGKLLWAPPPVSEDAKDRSIPARVPDFSGGRPEDLPPCHSTGEHQLFYAFDPGPTPPPEALDGLVRGPGDAIVSERFYRQLCEAIQDETSAIRRHSTRPITRSFVFVDVSDFSKMATGIQLMVVTALVRLTERIARELRAPEAQLCIGDGYIYVFADACDATIFAADLAQQIERGLVEKDIPEFHFRIGVHVGAVRCFWDPGRTDWNYVGDGINGGQRVLSAIGKETDDVVFVSGEARQEILRVRSLHHALFTKLENKGRKADKHGRAWRVYQLNHSAVDVSFCHAELSAHRT